MAKNTNTTRKETHVEENQTPVEPLKNPKLRGTGYSQELIEKSLKTPDELRKEYGNTSNAIRALGALGMETGDIARVMDISYQHARNVLKQPLKRPQGSMLAAETEAEAETE
jgi:hypothetical protein